ncbi:integrase catalytic domain-containing protein [Trichonephila clavipes]|uniref:Integrase catalytic domain-containing protein n=1 Tax=Trichonephila clavipes TaxID=2585209 RepID=A0A8X6SSD9_TRICX|nr:integrase catalytic domain-containing protein [Trichonephila clavipes]
MFQAIKGFKKEDLKYAVSEIEEISSNIIIAGLKDLILNSNKYKKDSEFIQEFLRYVVSEQKLQEAEKDKKEKEYKLEIRKLEAEKRNRVSENTIPKQREDILVEAYVRELIKFIISVQTKEKSSLTSLYDKLESHLHALETLGITPDKCASILYPMVESCFPADFLKAWNRSNIFNTNTDAKERLNNIMQFLKKEVVGEERISLAVTRFGLGKNQKYKSLKKKQFSLENLRNKVPTAMGL